MPPISSSPGKASLVLMLFLYIAPTMAQVVSEDAPGIGACETNEVIKFRGGTARLENDLFADTDQNYTSGVALTAVSHDIVGKLRPECLPTPVRLQAELIKTLNPGFWTDAENPAHTQNVVVKLGQSMFTPKDFARTDLVPDDRPYAGLLYVGMSWNRRKHEAQRNLEVLDTREITLGVMGPWALGEQAQNLIHDLIGVDRFLGWRNQLKNEPALQFALERKFRNYRGPGAIVPGFSVDSIRSLGLRLGNIETSASAGIEGRIGWNLPNDFGTYPIRPGAENRPPSAGSLHADRGNATLANTRPRSGVHLFWHHRIKACPARLLARWQPVSIQPPRHAPTLGGPGCGRGQCPGPGGRAWRQASLNAGLAHTRI